MNLGKKGSNEMKQTRRQKILMMADERHFSKSCIVCSKVVY